MNLLTYTEAAEFLGIKLTTLYAMVSRRRIPHVRLGGRLVRFDRAKLVSWIEAHRVPSAENCAAHDHQAVVGPATVA